MYPFKSNGQKGIEFCYLIIASENEMTVFCAQKRQSSQIKW
jgi:hypothetical protein